MKAQQHFEQILGNRRIGAFPRGVLAYAIPHRPNIIISISDIGTYYKPLFVDNKQCVEKLYLEFEDVDEGISGIQKEHVDQILDLVEKYKDEDLDWYVHCNAGASRSPAVAAIIGLIKGQKEVERWMFEMRCPNMLVYRSLMNEAIERNLI